MTRVVSLQKFGLHIRRTNTAVFATVGAMIKCAPGLTECFDALCVAPLVRREIGSNTMFGTSFTMVAQVIGRVTA